jgi:hypothetical protein
VAKNVHQGANAKRLETFFCWSDWLADVRERRRKSQLPSSRMHEIAIAPVAFHSVRDLDAGA